MSKKFSTKLKKLHAFYGTRKFIAEFCCLLVFTEVHNQQTKHSPEDGLRTHATKIWILGLIGPRNNMRVIKQYTSLVLRPNCVPEKVGVKNYIPIRNNGKGRRESNRTQPVKGVKLKMRRGKLRIGVNR
jgi:hypothetical protein